MKFNRIHTSVVLVIAIVVVVNLLAGQFSMRLDLTEDKQYTLSKATRDILRELEEPVTVKAYFSRDLPPDIARLRRDFMDMLAEYSQISDNMLVYEFLDPGGDEALETEAMKNGVQPVIINVREKDQMKQQKAFLGAVLSIGEDTEVIPVLEPGSAMEYALTTAIKKLSVKEKPHVGLVQGHGEPSIGQMRQVQDELEVLYNFESFALNDTSPVPDRFKTIAIVSPDDSISPAQLSMLDDFLARGGRIFIALNRVDGNLQNAYGSELTTGLEGWLSQKGVHVNNNFVLDANCASVTMQQRVGNAVHISSIAVPYIPILSNFADHPVTRGLETVIMQFASEIIFSGDSAVHFQPLIMTSEASGSLTAPQYFNYQKQWSEQDFPMEHMVVGAALEGPFAGNPPAKMVVIADGDFPVGGSGGQQQQVQPDNVSLMVNSIDWLSDDTGLIGLRTKGITSRPIKKLEDSKQSFLKYLNFLLPLFMVFLIGFFRFQYRRNQRIARMEAKFE